MSFRGGRAIVDARKGAAAGSQGRRFVVELQILPDEFQRLYAGSANRVLARDLLGGQTVQFPANALRQFVSEHGVQGSFELEIDQDNRLMSIRRLRT